MATPAKSCRALRRTHAKQRRSIRCCGEAHCSLALLENAWEWNTEQCGVEFRRCLDLNPNYAMAVAKYATSYLQPVGRFEEGAEWLKRALVLDPLSPLVHTDFACNLAYRGLFDEFEHEADKVLADDPAIVRLYWYQTKSRAMRGDHAGSAQAAECALNYQPEDPATLGFCAAAYSICGNETRAAEVRGKLEFLSQIRYVPFSVRAIAYDTTGSDRTFFSLLDRAIAEHEPIVRAFRMLATLSCHASHPNFRILLDKTGTGEKDFAQTAAIDLSGQSLR